MVTKPYINKFSGTHNSRYCYSATSYVGLSNGTNPHQTTKKKKTMVNDCFVPHPPLSVL